MASGSLTRVQTKCSKGKYSSFLVRPNTLLQLFREKKTMQHNIFKIMNAYAENTDLIHLVGLSLLANIDVKFILCILYVYILCVT
jgi:hypothetical protein